MLDLEVSTHIYIQLALGIENQSKGGEYAPLREEKKKPTTEVVHKTLASLQLSLKLLQCPIVGFIQLLLFFFYI